MMGSEYTTSPIQVVTYGTAWPTRPLSFIIGVTVFEKVTATRWRLTKESKLAIGSLLILIRNEWQTTCESIEATEEMRLSAAVTGSVVNYRKMIECLDRVLTRLEGTFDAGKLGIIAGMLEHILTLPESGPPNSLLIRAAELINEPTSLNRPGDRSDSQGGNRLPGTSWP